MVFWRLSECSLPAPEFLSLLIVAVGVVSDIGVQLPEIVFHPRCCSPLFCCAHHGAYDFLRSSLELVLPLFRVFCRSFRVSLLKLTMLVYYLLVLAFGSFNVPPSFFICVVDCYFLPKVGDARVSSHSFCNLTNPRLSIFVNIVLFILYAHSSWKFESDAAPPFPP